MTAYRAEGRRAACGEHEAQALSKYFSEIVTFSGLHSLDYMADMR
ncbi:hypothetical protein SACS_1532 [Parasaccharibacter apium]|uniref:Uncharacterized protein n=1 Tax=Parasaccharibacter apium TaxID=1510841 RepID=A0A7U7G6X2_9PROT|nr:hypothetical protein SACS_1532 [Parasaccharibacter apium]